MTQTFKYTNFFLWKQNCETKGEFYVCLELCDKGDLASIVKLQQSLGTPLEAARYTCVYMYMHMYMQMNIYIYIYIYMYIYI